MISTMVPAGDVQPGDRVIVGDRRELVIATMTTTGVCVRIRFGMGTLAVRATHKLQVLRAL